jgi:hypothetical protein
MQKIDPFRAAFRAHRIIAWAGLIVDECLQVDWVPYVDATECVRDDRLEVMTDKSTRGWVVSWRIEEKEDI